MLTNLVTLLHNYVSHEFAEAKKPFCDCVPDALRLVRMRTHVSRWV